MSTSGNTTNGSGKKRWEGGARSGDGQHRNPPIDQQQRQLDALKALCRARGIEQHEVDGAVEGAGAGGS